MVRRFAALRAFPPPGVRQVTVKREDDDGHRPPHSTASRSVVRNQPASVVAVQAQLPARHVYVAGAFATGARGAEVQRAAVPRE